MSFANPLPWWILLLVVGAAGLVASLAYGRRRLTPRQRAALVLLRMTTLLALVLFLMRPVSRAAAPDGVAVAIPVLVDTSKSMAIEDAADGRRRIDVAREIVTTRIVPALGPRFSADVLAFGETVAPGDPARLSATARRSDLAGALAAVRDRYRGRPFPGVVLVSDGGDTSGGAEKMLAGLPPVFAVGVGSTAGKDREILSVTVAEQILDESRVDLAVSAVSHGFGQAPIELRLLENGRAIDIRRVTPAADGVPVREVFQVSPGRPAATVYTVETPSSGGELVPENNARSVLVQPPARRRRVLLIEGAPGFEHSFLKRAWATDRGLEIDSVVRKGKDEKGADTFYIQAGRDRGPGLITGYPATRDALYFYDAIVLANVEAHQLTRTQLEATQAFVGRRGGGLLVLGGRAFLRQGFGDTPLEEVLPLEPAGPGVDAVPAADLRGTNQIVLTAAGEAHPIMQVAPAIAESRRRWNALPALASVSPLGGPRPGASVLAVAGTSGAPRALVAVQRFGEGRSMVFTGEASWRWRMMMPATDRVYDTFWKQSLRWIALGAGDPIQILTSPNAAAGEPLPIRVVVRNAAFEPQAGATVSLRVTAPDGRTESLSASADPSDAGKGHYLASLTPAAAGLVKIEAEARRDAAVIGAASHTVLVGGADPEMSDPRLNRQLLDRLTAASGGRVIEVDGFADLPRLLDAAPRAAIMGRRDLWHNGWSFAVILVLLGAEWLLRRRWGLR